MTASAVLVLNCGSSSVKFALVDPPSGRRLLSGLAERVGTARGHPRGRTPRGSRGRRRRRTARSTAVLVEVLAAVGRVEGVEVGAVGHRVVHGGQRFSASVRRRRRHDAGDRATWPTWRRCTTRPTLAGIRGRQRRAARTCRRWPCSTPPSTRPCRRAAYRYAVPKQWYDDYAVRRYGFHGTSHRYVSAPRRRAAGPAASRAAAGDGRTWATAAAPPRCGTAARSTPRWA